MVREILSPWLLFQDTCSKYSQNIMLIHNSKQYTYHLIYKRILYLEEVISLFSFNIAGMYLPNSPDFISWMLAINKISKPVAYLSYQFRGEVLAEMINYTDVDVLITDDHGYSEIQKLEDKVCVSFVIVMKDDGGIDIVPVSNINFSKRTLNNDTFGICFTSGSTSRPKGIVLSNKAITGNAVAVANYLGFTSNDRTLIPRSLAQASPISGDILMAISEGGSIVILNDLFHPGIFLKAIEQCQPTTIFMIRTMLSQVLYYPHLQNYNIDSLKRILLGGMINPKHIFEQATLKLPGVALYNAYGISEASARVTFACPEQLIRHPGTIGKPMKGCNIRILREDGSEAAVGEIGEIYVKSDYIMDGYYKSDELTRLSLTKEGLRTRDTGYYDAEGLFYVVGRSDDLMIQGGNKVYPIDIEEVLLKHPSISEVVVFGVPDDVLGKRIVALIVANNSKNANISDIYKYCRQHLEDKKVPKEMYIIDKIPRNITGKISRKELVDFYINNIINERT